MVDHYQVNLNFSDLECHSLVLAIMLAFSPKCCNSVASYAVISNTDGRG